MKTIAALLLLPWLAAGAAAQKAAELDFGSAESRPEETVRAAPEIPTLDVGGDGASLQAGSSLDFLGGSAAPSGPPLQLPPSGPMLDVQELKNRTFVPKGGFARYGPQKRGFKTTQFSPNRVEYKGARGGSGAPRQIAEVGAVQVLSNGSKMTLLDYDPSKAYGERHHWQVETADGRTTEFHSSPLIFDLNGDGVRMSRKASRFDANGDLKKDTVNEISASDGLLVFDANKNGSAGESGLEAFGTATDLDNDHKSDGFPDGFEALWALARKAQAEGVLAPGALDDDTLGAEELRALEKAYGLGMRVGSVQRPAVGLEKAGVRSIHLTKEQAERAKNFDGQGNESTRRPGATFLRPDGSAGVYEDVWFEL